jgi:mutator protein MutT
VKHPRTNADTRQYPARPIPGVGALIFEAGKVLLVRRANEPLAGFWSLPGGAIELGEKSQEALLREVKEETGLDVEVVRVAEIFDRIFLDAQGEVEYHYVLIDWLCRPTGGTLRHASDASAARWVTREEIGSLTITSGTLDVILRHWVNE